MAEEKFDDSIEGLDLEAGLEAAFHDDSDDSTDRSVLAQLAGDGTDLMPVLLRDPESKMDLTPVVRPGEKRIRGREGRYQVLGEIARGGVGVVFKGHDVDLGRDVAMKVIREEHEETPELIQRFVEEAQIGGQLQHPGIVPVYEIGLGKNKRPYFTMKLIKGKTLSALLGARGSTRDGRRRLLSIFESVCQTMAYAHARGVIHRDLKPSNVMVGSFGEVLVVDWGMGKVLRQGGVADERKAKLRAEQTVVTTLRSAGEGSASVIGSVMGTPRYMSPEQARGDVEHVDERSDVFGLGAILCEILTGSPPYTGKDEEVFTQAAMAELDDAYQRLAGSGAEEDLIKIAKRCLMPAPEARFANAGAVAKAVGAYTSAVEERAEQAKLAAVRAEEQAESERAAAEAARAIAQKEKEAADQAHRARKLTLALASVVLLVVAAGAGLWFQEQRAAERERELTAQAVSDHLAEADRLLQAGDLDLAAQSAARAHERDPSAAGPIEFRERIADARRDAERKADLAAAEAARTEARAALEKYAELKLSIAALADQVAEERLTFLRQAAEEEDRAAFALREIRLENDKTRRPALLASALESVERARRLDEKWGETDARTRALIADILVEQWRLARQPMQAHFQRQYNDSFDAEGDVALASAYHAAALDNDVTKRHEEELLGRGSLTIRVTPADAEVHLFRYESYETVRTDKPVIPRLVPVPTTGIGRAKVEGFTPGDTCFVIESVAHDSPAAQAGLNPGDLVLSINEVPCDSGECISSVTPDSLADKAGIQPWSRVERANDLPAIHWFINGYLWRSAKQRNQGNSVTAGGIRAEAPAGELIGFTHGPTIGFLGSPEFDLQAECLKDGEPVTVSVPKGQVSGITPRVTAYPLVLNRANRVEAGRKLTVDPGSYLVHVRGDGYEAQRYSVLVTRGGEFEANLDLHEIGTSPEGFVFVPAGPYLFGDRKAFRAGRRTESSIDGFWIQATPVTFRQYFEFLNDPAVRKEIEESNDEKRLLPRWVATGEKDGPLMVEKDENGRYFTRKAALESAVLGVYLTAPLAYAEWLNAKAEANGEPWVYDLPNEEQYEKAARGADGRAFSWGPRFDHNLCIGNARLKDTQLYWAPVRCEPRDESPYEVADATGCRWEMVWSREITAHSEMSDRKNWLCKGGYWSGYGTGFRIAGRGYGDGTPFSGFRVVATRR